MKSDSDASHAAAGLYIFDILMINGERCTDKPLGTRLAVLQRSVREVPGVVALVPVWFSGVSEESLLLLLMERAKKEYVGCVWGRLKQPWTEASKG